MKQTNIDIKYTSSIDLSLSILLILSTHKISYWGRIIFVKLSDMFILRHTLDLNNFGFQWPNLIILQLTSNFNIYIETLYITFSIQCPILMRSWWKSSRSPVKNKYINAFQIKIRQVSLNHKAKDANFTNAITLHNKEHHHWTRK